MSKIPIDDNRPTFPVYGNHSPILLDATNNKAEKHFKNSYPDDPSPLERNSAWRRSDQQHLIKNGGSKNLNSDTIGLETRSPSTPGGFETEVKSLLAKDRKYDSQEFHEHSPAPDDRGYLVYMILVIHGMGTLMPWNMFITADKYFMDYKLSNPAGEKTEYAKNFLSYLGICSQVPNLVLSFTNLFIQIKGSLTKRIVFCLLFTSVVFIFTIILAMVDSHNWPGWFFALTMLSVVVINSANGIYQNSVYGLAADLPATYSNAVVLGTNISGTFVSVVNILMLYISPNLKTAAIYYFVTALCVLLLCLDTYFVLPFCRFFRYHHDLGAFRRSRETAVEEKSARISRNTGCLDKFLFTLRPYVQVVKQAWIHMWNIFFIFFVSLTIFPAMMANVKPLSKEFPVSETYFTPVTCFLLFNTCAMIGNFFANFVRVPGPRWVWVPVLLRGFMIPYFMFCNYRPEYRTFPVYLDSDWAYVGMGILMAFSAGYLSSLVMMYAPRVVEKEKARIAAMMAAFFLIAGIVAGIWFTLVVAYINENLGPLIPQQFHNATLNVAPEL